MQKAVTWKLRTHNPADGVTPPAVRPREVRPINETQAAWLLTVAEGKRLYIPIMLAVTTGMRRGEILAIRWQDVDWDVAVLKTNRALEESTAGIAFKEPKSGSGRRTVAIPALLVETLRVHCAKQQEYRAILGTSHLMPGQG